MSRFVLRFTDPGAVPPADLSRIRARSGVTVLDESSRMFLIEATPRQADQLAGDLPGWVASPEQFVPVPDARPRVRPSSK